jgi:hypothetical protein
VDLPTSALQAVTIVKTPGYEGDLIRDFEQAIVDLSVWLSSIRKRGARTA